MIGDIVEDADMRVIQLFLDRNEPFMYEVSANESHDVLACTCEDFTTKVPCKHVEYVAEKIEGNNGAYPMHISTRATREDAQKAVESSKDFRDFLVKYGKIEVI